MSKPFHPQIIIFKDVVYSDAILKWSFDECHDYHLKHKEWTLVNGQPTFRIFEYVANPHLGKFTIVIYDGNGSPSIVFHENDGKALAALKDFLQAIDL